MKFVGARENFTINKTSTGIPKLDEILGGGIPVGRVVELFGKEGSGKTTLSLAIAASRHGRHRGGRHWYLETPPFQFGDFSLAFFPIWDWESFSLCSWVRGTPLLLFADLAAPLSRALLIFSLFSGFMNLFALAQLRLCSLECKSSLSEVLLLILRVLMRCMFSGLRYFLNIPLICAALHPYSAAIVLVVASRDCTQRSTISFSGRFSRAGISITFRDTLPGQPGAFLLSQPRSAGKTSRPYRQVVPALCVDTIFSFGIRRR